MLKKAFAAVAAVLTFAAMPGVASAARPAYGKVKLAMVDNTYYDWSSGQGPLPSKWVVQNCVTAYTSVIRWNWGAWAYNGKRPRLCRFVAAGGAVFVKIEQGYWAPVVDVGSNQNPCTVRSDRGQPSVPWGVIDDLLQGVTCPADPGWK